MILAIAAIKIQVIIPLKILKKLSVVTTNNPIMNILEAKVTVIQLRVAL